MTGESLVKPVNSFSAFFVDNNDNYTAHKQYRTQVWRPVNGFFLVNRYLYRAKINHLFLFGVGKPCPDEHDRSNDNQYDAEIPVHDMGLMGAN